MKVEALIKELEKMNPEAEVYLHHPLGKEVLFCLTGQITGQRKVWLEDEFDNDMEEELNARYKHALESGMDELDFYMNLLEIGITTEMVRVYLDDEHADHMKEFCEEHGLI